MTHTEIELPWVEKYRPSNLSEVIGHEEITNRLKNYVKTRNLPNMLFSGPAGVGKTSSAIALARELFGKNFEQNFLELNASDDRGIDVVRNTIKDFARTLAFDSDFKIIFLDECDALTSDAQQALRRTMEKYTKTCRFILSCVTPETKLTLPNETEITMQEFMKLYEEKKISLVASKAEDKIVTEQAICFTEQRPQFTGKKVLEITTDTGRKINATTEHLLLTENGWKKTADLKLGEKIIVYPSLEGTPHETRNEKVFEITDFENYYDSKIAKKYPQKNRFAELPSKEKAAILYETKGLLDKIRDSQGLTKKELEAYEIIKNAPGQISRKEIQEKMSLSRVRTAQLLKEIETPGFIERQIKGKIHYFTATEKEPFQIRNLKDAVTKIAEEKNIKISYSNIRNHLFKKTCFTNSAREFIKPLKDRNLTDITYSDNRIAALTRIFGFIYGDGHITKNGRSIIFTGNELTLKEIKKDLHMLGFSGTEITSKKLQSEINGRKIEGHTISFKLNSNSFGNLLAFLGAPKGDKILNEYLIPPWIMNGTKIVKREFLRSLFGCEGYSPKIKNKNFEEINLRMHKAEHLNKNMLAFYEQLKLLLLEFEVKTKTSIIQQEYERKDGIKTNIYALHLDSNNKNLFNFFTRIGYAYEKEKNAKARLGGEYLRHKLYALETQKEKGIQILNLLGTKSKRAIAREVNCSVDYVINQSKGKEAHLEQSFSDYPEWTQEHDAKNGFIFNSIKQIKETDAEKVMDLTCTKYHNFIANGFIAHNCNYSSKILEPIQSRCVIYRFKPLNAKDVDKQIDLVSEKEKITTEEKAKKAVNYVSNGDLRKALNILQASATLDKKITEEIVYSVSSRARPEQVQEMILLALKGKFIEARKKLEELMYEQGMSGEDIILQLYRETMNLDEKELSEKYKIELVDTIGEYDFRIVEGANDRIQLEALLAQYMKYKK
jgi:replication factor C small subunit